MKGKEKRILHGVLTLVFALGLMMIPGLLPETVCTASAEDAAVGHAGQEGWTEWTDTTSLPTEVGKYYLTEDVTLNGSWYVPVGETTLCLNGKTIRTRAGKTYPLIQILSSLHCKLTVCDHSSAKSGSIGGGLSVGGGVYVKNGTFTLESGSINGNRAGRGGGVYIDGGTFNMKGGSISGNTAVHTGASIGEGGGVYIDGGTFNMEGGSISGNTADLGGGVYINGGTFNIGSAENEESKDINISGNRSNGKTNNVSLSSGRTITVTGHVGEASKIGVTTDTKPQDSNPVVFTAGLNGKGSISNFLSDEGYAVTRTEGDSPEAQLTDHKHQWTINEAASGNGYEIKCDAANCHYGVYTATAEDQDYTGKPYGGAVIDAESALPPELSISPWTYTGRGDTTYGPSETTPTNAGIYTASAEMKTWADPDKIETISLPFSIKPAPLTITANDQTLTYNGQTQGEGDTTYEDAAQIAEKVTTSGLQGSDKLTKIDVFSQGKEVGEYPITLSGAAIGNATANYAITYVNGKLTITPIPLKVTINGSSAKKTYNGKQQTYKGTVAAKSSDPAFDASKFSYTGSTVVKGTKAGVYTTRLATESCVYNDPQYELNVMIGSPVKLTITEKNPEPKPQPGPVIDKATVKIALDAGVIAKSSGSKVTASWGAVKGASSYVIYANYCDQKKCKKIKTVSGKTTSFNITKLNGKKFNPKKNLKFYVVAYKTVKGKKVKLAKSIMAHAPGSKNSKRTNVTGVKVKKASFKLKKGKTAKIKAKLVLQKKSKKPLKHCAKFRYASSNKKVAKVSKKGKITAVGKGKCTVYVYAVSGVSKKIKVTVK